MSVKVGTQKKDPPLFYALQLLTWEISLRFACLVSTHGNEDHAIACSQIQNFVNNLEIENSQNKDGAKISESTVHR